MIKNDATCTSDLYDKANGNFLIEMFSNEVVDAIFLFFSVSVTLFLETSFSLNTLGGKREQEKNYPFTSTHLWQIKLSFICKIL